MPVNERKGMARDKNIDESWKNSVEKEKQSTPSPAPADGKSEIPAEEEQQVPEVDFAGFVSSLAFQGLIFLGEIPNPMAENKVTPNLPQAKYIVDTLLMFREKTKGNLTKEEDDLLGISIYELQIKYIAQIRKDSAPEEPQP